MNEQDRAEVYSTHLVMRVKSASSNHWYRVRIAPYGARTSFACSCKGFQYHKRCKHLARAKELHASRKEEALELARSLVPRAKRAGWSAQKFYSELRKQAHIHHDLYAGARALELALSLYREEAQ